MKKIFLGVMSAILLLTACETIKPIESPDSLVDDVASVDSVIFTANLGAQSKTYLDYTGYSYKTLWAADDEILIWNAAHLNETKPTTFEFCSIRSGAGTETAEFIGTMEADTYVALYAHTYYYPLEGLPSIELPMEQYLWYRNGEYNLGDNTYPMIAVSDSKHFEFQNPCSILKVSITGNDEYLESVTVSSTNGELMSGQVVLYDNYGDYELRFVGETEADGVYSWVDFYAGAYLSDEPVDCYIVVPAQYYSGGLDFYIQTDEGYMTVSTGSPVTTSRSKYYDVAIDYRTEVERESLPDGVYHVPTSVTLTAENASEYLMTETAYARYERYDLISNDDKFYVVSVDDGDVTYFAGSDYEIAATQNNYACVSWEMDLMENCSYYLQSGINYFCHIVLEASEDYVDMPQIVYLPTLWNVRGSFNNWGNTEMSLEDYGWNYAVFALRDVEFNGTNNSFKFDYSGEWSISPSSEYPYFNIVTNLGSDGYGNLIYDGSDIFVANPGLYDIVLTWDATRGDATAEYSYEIIYKGEATTLDFSNCQLELVGSSLVSGSPDTSDWNWGNVVLADNDGYPSYEDGAYKWRWTYVTLWESDYVEEWTDMTPGFKVRTVGYQPSGGIPTSDWGADCLDYANSYSGVCDYLSNIAVDYTSTYEVVMTIDANTGVTKILVCLQ